MTFSVIQPWGKGQPGGQTVKLEVKLKVILIIMISLEVGYTLEARVNWESKELSYDSEPPGQSAWRSESACRSDSA